MATDIRLNDNAVIIDGPLGQGTDVPKRPIHTENGEIHSGGGAGGLSFADRSTTTFHDVPTGGQRWVWYAQGGAARLWSGADGLTVRRTGNLFDVTLAGKLTADRVSSTRVDVTGPVVAASVAATGPVTAASVAVDGQITASSLTADGTVKALRAESEFSTATHSTVERLEVGTVHAGSVENARLVNVRTERLRGSGVVGDELIHCRANGLALNDPTAPEFQTGPPTELVPDQAQVRQSAVEDPPPPMPPPTFPIPPRLALFHEFGPGADRLVLNRLGRYTQGVQVHGGLDVTGALTQGSSIALKDDVRPLPAAAAMDALQQLSPVTFRYKDDQRAAQRVGFIAEAVPDLVALPGRDRLSPMDLVAVLTAAVQEQQRTLVQLTAQVRELRQAAA